MIDRRSPEKAEHPDQPVESEKSDKGVGEEGTEANVEVPVELTEEERRREEHERALDQLAETMFLRASKVNEGNNAAILHLDVQLLSPELIEFCEESGIDLGDSRAVKVMKVYRGGEGEREFDLHKRAYNAVGSDADKVALIPRPVLYRDIELTAPARQKVAEVTGKDSERAEVIVMDFIEGEDIAEIMLKAALLKVRPDIESADEVKGWSVDRLAQEVGPRIDYRKPGGKADTQAARAIEAEKVEEDNADKLYKFLVKSGYRLDPTLLERFERTFEILHAAGIVHRDAHERNLMIAGDPWVGEDSEGDQERRNTAYVIDFGASIEFSGHYNSQVVELYRDEDRRYYQDEKVIRRLKALAIPETGRDRHVREDGEKWIGVLARKRRAPSFAKGRDAWLARHDMKHGEGSAVDSNRAVNALYSHFFKSESAIMLDNKFQVFADYLFALVEQGRSDADGISSALRLRVNAMASLPARGRVNELARAVEFLGRQQESTEN